MQRLRRSLRLRHPFTSTAATVIGPAQLNREKLGARGLSFAKEILYAAAISPPGQQYGGVLPLLTRVLLARPLEPSGRSISIVRSADLFRVACLPIRSILPSDPKSRRDPARCGLPHLCDLAGPSLPPLVSRSPREPRLPGLSRSGPSALHALRRLEVPRHAPHTPRSRPTASAFFPEASSELFR